jgi:hypothetical protein
MAMRRPATAPESSCELAAATVEAYDLTEDCRRKVSFRDGQSGAIRHWTRAAA